MVSRVLLAAVLTPHDKGVSPGIVLHVGKPPAQHRTVLQVVLVPRITEWVLLEGHTFQPMGEGTLLAFPESLLRALEALFLVGEQAVGEPPLKEPASLPDCDLNLDMDLQVGADEDDQTS